MGGGVVALDGAGRGLNAGADAVHVALSVYGDGVGDEGGGDVELEGEGGEDGAVEGEDGHLTDDVAVADVEETRGDSRGRQSQAAGGEGGDGEGGEGGAVGGEAEDLLEVALRSDVEDAGVAVGDEGADGGRPPLAGEDGGGLSAGGRKQQQQGEEEGEVEGEKTEGRHDDGG